MHETPTPVSLNSIQDARRVIARSAVRTPLVKLNVLDAPAEIYLKLENLQPIGSFNIDFVKLCGILTEPAERQKIFRTDLLS